VSVQYPKAPSDSVGGYAEGYFETLMKASAAIDRAALARAGELLRETIARGGEIFACGNGGSAAISNHLECDCLKGIQTDTASRPRVRSLSANVAILTAIGNDISFDEIFVYQLRTLARKDDVLITVSASGNSENIVRAVAWAREAGVKTVAMTGFDGGRSAALADINLHVPAANYGIVEDLHQSLMHILSQFLRQAGMPADLVAQRRF
jgi:phosphoheptose isomerase